MKRIAMFLGAMMLSLGLSAAVKTVTWSLPGDWETGVEYSSIALPSNATPRLVITGPDFGYPSDPVGAPALPFIPVSIKVAEGSVLSNCTVEASWKPVETAFRPSIVNEPYVVGEAPIYSPEDPQYFGAARYPATPESVGGVQTCADDTSIMAWVTPYRWNGQTGMLEKATALKLTFTYDAPRTKLRLSTSATTYTGLFLIISPSQFKDMWGNYLDYRRGTHPQIEFEVVNTADIYAKYDGKDDAQRIHKYLEYRYKNRGGRTMYVILGGGCKKDSESYNRATMIPLPMTATRNRLYYPSDLYYACMDNPAGKGEVWDPNNDGILLGYKSGGGYVSDARGQVDVMPDIAVSRFPVRPTASLDGKSKSAQQQIDGLVAKLRRAEAADFAGNHNAGLAGLKIFAEKSHGNTENWMTQERTFYDGMVNIWSASHASPVDDFEYNLRNQHVNWWFQNRPLNNFYGATSGNPNAVANNNMEFYVNEAHGAPSGAGPLSNTQMWKATAIQKIALWDMPCSTGKIDDDRLTLPEAMILNPDGGALVSYNNAREGYGSANNFDTLSALMERENRRAYLANDLNNRTSGEAFIEAHRTFLNSVGGIQMSTTAMSCYIETLAFGDPLVKLSQVQDGNVGASPSGLFLRTGTTTATDINVGSQSSVVTLKTPDLGGGTLTIRGQSFKAYKGATVNNGNLLWSAPGGVGGSGLKFTTARGNLTVSATGTTYFGPNFSNVNNLLVTGYNCTLDFDKTGSTRDVTQLGFIGTGNSAGASGTNYLRCREGGIFSPTMTIPVVNGTLALQTQNIGGGGAASNPNVPIFALTNATLRVDTNPNWGAEFFNRAIYMNNATVAANYQSVGFGANVDARPGLDIWVFGDKGSVIAGPQDFEIVGELRVHCEDGARITSTASLNKSSRVGSISKLGSGTLTLSAKNTVSGGIRVKEGTLVADTGTCLGTGEVIVESGAVLQLKVLPVNSITRLTVKSGGKLILPGNADTASYKIVDPLVSSLRFESGSIVCNVNAPDTPLSGSTTTDGCYLDTSLFLNWKGGSGNWSTATTDTNWKTKTVESKAFAQGDSVQFPDYGKVTNTVTVSGALAPGQINFSNPDTAYRFKGTGSSISLGTLYTGGDVSFEPSLAVDGTMAVTAGRTEVNNVGATAVSVGPDATFKVNGEVASYVYIKKIELNITKFNVNKFTWPAFLGGGTVVDCKGWRVGEIQFYRGNEVVTLPVGTSISVYAPNGVSANKLTYKTWNATVTSSSNGKVTAVSGDSDPKNMFDMNTSSYMGIVLNSGSDGEHNYAPTCKVTITPSSPIKMFTGFKIGSADTRARNPDSWTLSVTENSTGSAKTVLTRSGQSTGSNSSLWSYSLDSTPSASGSTAVSVAAGGALENGGTYKAKVNFADGAKIKVGGSGTINVAGGVTFGGNTTIDVSEAQKISGWREILSGANLTTADVYKFPLSSDDAVAKVENGKLYVATENIVKGPYSRQVSGTCNWNTTDWKNGDAAFPATWSSVITRPTSILYLDVTNATTMAVNCPVSVGSVYVTNSTQNAASLNLTGDRSDFLATLLDFSGFNGPVIWEPNINGASVNISSNNVTLSNGAGGTLAVASNGFATVVGPFTGYNVDKFARVHFTKTNRGLTMSQIPAAGTVSFDGMELQDGGGGFQKGDLTYRIENGQTLTLKETGSMNARTQSSFEIYGGTLTIKPNGAWWFGQNGVTSYTQTNGTVTVEATGTTVGNSGSGVVFGYTGEASFVFEMNISGGRFEVPNSILNIWNPTTISLSSNAVLKAKGAGARSGIAGTIEMGEGTIFEVGSAGLAAGSMKYNLYGGTLAAFEDTTVSAPIALGGSGTLAAKENTMLAFNGTINADNATLNIGKPGYSGTVKFAMDELPAGVTNYTVTAGTWDLGELRPTNSILSRLDGKIAVELDDDELRQASGAGFEIIRLADGVTDVGDKVQVIRADGTAVPATGIAKDGKLYLKVNWVYPLYGEVPEGGGEVEWSDLNWHDAIGMPFTAEWTSAITSAVLSNNCAEAVTTTITNGLTTSLKVVNSGELHIVSETMYTAMSTLDDSLSTGKTTIGFTANNVAAGAETVVKKAGSGTLTLAADKCAALWNNLAWGGTISGFSGTAKIKYVGDNTLTSLNYTSDGAGYVSYAQKVAMSELAFANSLTRFFEEGADVTVTRFVMGNQKNTTGQTFHQTGGKIVVTGTGTILGSSPTGTSPLLFSHWENPVTYYLTGGELIATNGVDGSVYFGRDGVPKLYIGGGNTKATLRTNGLINRSDTKDKTGSVIELKPNGYLEIGNKNFVLYQNAELKMSGGTFLAYESAEIKSDTSKFTLTANTTSYLSATNGATLTVSKVPTGTGTLVCNPANDGSKVVLSGDYSAITLGGTFTLKMTDEQRDAKVNTTLFKTADGFDATKVAIKNSDGSDATGAYHLTSDGKFQWVPANAYVMPLVGTISGEKAWSEIGWRDSSAEPKTVSSDYLANSGLVATFELAVENDAAITGTATAGMLVVSGTGVLTIPNTLTVATMKGSGKVVANGYMPTWGGLTANAWTGTVKLTGTFPAGKDIGALGNVNSTIEFAGNMPEPTDGYFATPVEVNAPFVLSGTMEISNGNSNSIQVKFNKKFSGAGSFTTVDNSKPGKPDIFQVLGDASEFFGDITLAGAAHSITFGAHNYGYGGYLYVTADTGATIAAGKQWIAHNAINVDAGGVLNLQPRANDSYASTSTVNVSAGGYINLLQTDASQTVWPITSGTLTLTGGVKVNGVIVGKDRYSVSGGKITLNGNAVGASVSINVGGGGTGGVTGLLIADANYAGVVPVKGSNWNQDGLRTDGNAVDRTISNLKEVLADGSVITGPMKVRLLAKNVWSAKNHSTPTNGDAQMMFGYLDDGSCSTTGAGAGFYVDNIPYTTYDVYVYMGSDADSANPAFVAINVTDGTGTKTKASSWGDAATTHNTVTLTENSNYCKFTGCTGSSLKVIGSTKSNSLRGGLAAIQIFNTGTRVNTLTWKGDATSGTWDKTATSWSSSASASTTWTEVSDGVNTAKFNGNTSLSLGETVCPDVLDIASNNVSQTHAAYLQKGSGNSAVVATGMKLADITSVSATMGGAWTDNNTATPCYLQNDGSTLTVQFQRLNNQLKCVKVVLTQDGDNIKGYVEYSAYVNRSAEPNSVNFDTYTASDKKSADTATGDNVNGYGIKNLKLSIDSVGNLTVASAEKFGKAFVVTNGVLTVAADTLAQDVTLGPGTKLNVLSAEIATEYVMTKGTVIGGTMANLLFNGDPLESGSWTIEGGKLKRVVKPGTTPFTYTIAESGETQWTNAPWVAHNWFYVRPEEWTTNTVAEAKLAVNGGVTNTLVANANIALNLFKIGNSGVLAVTNGTFNLTAETVDDSASSGTTTLGFAPTNVLAGADTILSQSITGKLTVGAGNKATINGTATSYDVSSGGEVRYVGDEQITAAFANVEGATFAYRRAKLALAGSEYWKLKLYDGDLVTATGTGHVNPIEVTGGELVLTNTSNASAVLYGGKDVTGKSHSSITVSGGKLTVLASGTTGTDSGKCGFLLGQTARGDTTASVAISGGEMNVAGLFTCWERSNVSVANGILRAKGFYKQAGGDSTLAINAGGIFEFGASGIAKTDGKSIAVTMNGGTLRASDNAEAKLPIALTGENTFSAANGKTMTVSGLLSGAGGLAIGEEGWTGTVKFTAAPTYTGATTLAYGTLEVPSGALKGNVTIGPNATLNVTGTPGQTEYAITDGTVTGEIANIKLNGNLLPDDEKWEIEGGKIKRRIITPPFKFIITQNGNWNDQTWYDANNIVLRDYEVAEASASKPSVTLEVQSESSLFVTNALDLTSLAATGQKVTLDFSQMDGNALAAQATFLHPSTNVFIKTTSEITGTYATAAPNLPADYTGEFLADATGLRYVVTAPRRGYDYVGTIENPTDYYAAFDDIQWEGGVAFTNDYQNTVTINVAGDIDLHVSAPLTLYKMTFAQLDAENPAYVYLFADGDFADTFANVRSFDFGGAAIVDTLQDFDARIERMPSLYLQLSCSYAGPLKDGYSFNGEDNAIVGGEFAGALVSVSGSGTLTGDFAISAGGSVFMSGNYAGADSAFDIGAGALTVSYGDIVLGAITGTDANGALALTYGGVLTANLNGFAGSVTVGSAEADDTGTLHLAGVAAGAVTVSANGTLCLSRTAPDQTVFPVTTGTLDFQTGAKLYVDGEQVGAQDILSTENGTITIRAYDPPTTPFIFIIAESGTNEWSKAAWVGSNGSPVRATDWTNENVTAVIRGEAGKSARLVADVPLNLGALAIETAEKVVLGRTNENALAVATLSVASGYAVALESGVSVTTYDVQAGGHIHFLKSDEVASPIVSTAGAMVSYKNAKFTTAPADYSWILRVEDGDSATVSSATQFFPVDVRGGTLTLGGTPAVQEYIYGGKNGGGDNTNSVITVNGGRVFANITGTTGSSNRGFIYGCTASNIKQHPTIVVNSGEFDISTGVLSPWEFADLVVNGGVLKAKGVCKGGNYGGAFSLNGGELQIGASGISTRGSTFPITVGGDAKITSTAAMSVSLPTTVGEDCTLTFNAAAGDINASAANIVNNGKIVVEAGNVNLGTARGAIELKGSTTTITLYETINDGGAITLKSENANGIVMKRADGTTAIDDVKVTDNGDGTFTYAFTPQLDGKVCWWDYEFEGNDTNAGTEGGGFSWDGDRPFKDNEYVDGKALRVPCRPYRSVTWPTEDTTFVIYGKMVKNDNAYQLCFGTRGGNLIFLATGSVASNEVVLCLSQSGTVTKLKTMTVPNAQAADHLYAFTLKTVENKTVIDVYLDGELLESYNVGSKIALGGGFQIASPHGGTVSGYSRTADSDPATIDFLRVYKCELSATAMKAYAEEYPYVSPNGSYTRVVTESEITWKADDDEWIGHKPGEEASLTNAPAANATVELDALDDTTITMALDKDVTYEAMTIDGEDETVVTITNAADATGQVKITGRLTVNTDATIDARAIDVANTPVTIAPGKTLTIDMQHAALDELLQTTVIKLTGAATTGLGAKVGVITGDMEKIAGRTLTVEPDANQHYEMKVEVVPEEVSLALAIDEGEVAFEGEKQIDIPLGWTLQLTNTTALTHGEVTKTTVASALNAVDEIPNGIKPWESYVLTLSPTDALSKPVPLPVQTASPTSMLLKLGNVAVREAVKDQVNVTYSVITSDTAGGEGTPTVVDDPSAVQIQMPENGVKYYRFNIQIAPK